MATAVTILLLSRGAAGQSKASPPSAGSDLRVFILTFGPGDDPWEKFGHNAVEIIDPSAPEAERDITYNWGTFKFDDGFYWKFAKGRLLYMMTGDATADIMRYYVDKLHRNILRQELNLSPRQKTALRDLLLKTDTEQNRYYLYDYYKNNCTSKIRDVIDDLIDHDLAKATRGVPSHTTYRWHTDRLDADALWLYVALQADLGLPVDRPIDRWQEMFLPAKLHDRLNEVTEHVDGHPMPLVKSDEVLYKSDRPPEPSAPPRWTAYFFATGLALAALFAALGRRARRNRGARWGFVLLSTPWLLLMGVGGAVILWMGTATDHVVTRPNENIMHISVLALPLILLLPMSAFGSRRARLLTRYIALAMVGISVVGVLLKALPMFYQANWNIIAMCLPANAALAYAAWVMTEPSAMKPSTPELAAKKMRAKRS